MFTLSPVLLSKYHFLTVKGKLPNLDSPQSFDEKLMWLTHYWRHPLKTMCSDKYAVRFYILEHGLGHILTKLYGVYRNTNEIDIATLPNRFVLKCTHGCGYNIICKNKLTLDWEESKRKLNTWMKIDISKLCGEVHYAGIRPRIICEHYLDDFTGDTLRDYKVYCFQGKAHCTMVCSERDSLSAKFDHYDRAWKNKLPYDKESLLSNRNIPKPEAYEEMISAAEILSKPFPFVRMDFYNINGRAVFGEMTFTPHGCADPDYPEAAQKTLGKLIKLPDEVVGFDTFLK